MCGGCALPVLTCLCCPGVLPLCCRSPASDRAPRPPPSPLQPPGRSLAPCRSFSNNKIQVELDESSGTAVAPLRCHPQPTGMVGHRQGPFHPCPMACVALGMESHQSSRCCSCSCLGASGRSVWGRESHLSEHFGWLVLQANPGCHCPLPVHCPLSGGLWFGHLAEWQHSIREELLRISVTWLPGIAVMGPCP